MAAVSGAVSEKTLVETNNMATSIGKDSHTLAFLLGAEEKEKTRGISMFFPSLLPF